VKRHLMMVIFNRLAPYPVQCRHTVLFHPNLS
jgi:hypothetical protein